MTCMSCELLMNLRYVLDISLHRFFLQFTCHLEFTFVHDDSVLSTTYATYFFLNLSEEVLVQTKDTDMKCLADMEPP